MKRIKFIILLSVLIFANIRGFSQENESGGSAYSIFGIGDINYYTSTRTYTMGILGTSLFGNYVNNLNPATMTKLNSTLITINGNYGFLKTANDISENNVSNGNVLGVNIGIPFDQIRGWVFSLGFNPMTLVNYKVKVKGTIGGQNYTQSYSGKGGLSRINAGMSYNLAQKISVGLEYNFGFGEINNQNFVNFNNQSYTNSDVKNQYDFKRSFMKAGLIFEVGRLIKSLPLSMRNFNIGFVFQSGINLTATQDGIFRSSLSTDTVRLNTGEINIPDSYGFGITNTFGRKYVLSGDVLFQDWSKYTEFGQTNPNYQMSYRAGLGMEILPDENSISFWGGLTYRFGGFYDKAFYKVENQDINAYGVRAGVNIPLSRYNSIDFGLNYSVKGTKDNGLLKDEFINLTAGINFGELWFIRPKEEDQ